VKSVVKNAFPSRHQRKGSPTLPAPHRKDYSTQKECFPTHVIPQVLYFAKAAAALQSEGSVQLFPPGTHEIIASNSKDDIPLKVTIDAATADTLETQRAAYQAKADAGEGDAPYLDFNHNDQEAAAWPKRIYWGGDDPLLGGVRAEVEWSTAGDLAVKGKTYRRFSPAFYAANGRITGAPVNMGGLVNRAAFTKIQPLFAKEKQETTPTMSPEEITALQEENATLKTQLTEMQQQLDAMTATAKAAAEKEADEAIEAAAREGRIGTTDAIKAKWKATLLANPESKELLMALPVNPALAASAIKAKAKDTTEDATAILAKYHALPRAEQPAYFAQHRDAIKTARDSAIR
jgi:hypothetical protein